MTSLFKCLRWHILYSISRAVVITRQHEALLFSSPNNRIKDALLLCRHLKKYEREKKNQLVEYHFPTDDNDYGVCHPWSKHPTQQHTTSATSNVSIAIITYMHHYDQPYGSFGTMFYVRATSGRLPPMHSTQQGPSHEIWNPALKFQNITSS